jgi:hypothetical protein
MDIQQRTVSEVDGFINMLHAACEDQYMNETLERLLSLPDKKRKDVVLRLVEELENSNAPTSLTEAIACLVDDAIAEKAYEVIYQCSR